MMNQSTSSPPEGEKPPSSVSLGQSPPPPMMMHSGYPVQPQHIGYPDPSNHHYPHQSMQPQHMNNTYYTSSHFPHMYPEPRPRCSFTRGLLFLITMLVIIVTTMTLLFWAIFGTDVPHFTLESLSVPSFEFTNSTLNAAWEASVIVYNPNKNLKASFEHTEGRLVYKDILIDAAMVDPILNLNSHEGKSMSVKFVAPSSDNGSTGSFWFHEIEEDRKKGSVGFSLRFVTYATFTSGDFWRRQAPLAIICDDILVQFPAPTGGGQWNGTKKDCFITA